MFNWRKMELDDNGKIATIYLNNFCRKKKIIVLCSFFASISFPKYIDKLYGCMAQKKDTKFLREFLKSGKLH